MAKKITLQDVFTAGWRNFVVGKKKPSRIDGNCAYRFVDSTNTERRCIVGWALPIKVLNEMPKHGGFNNMSVVALSDEMPELFDSERMLTIYRKSGDNYVAATIQVSAITAISEAQCDLHDNLCTRAGEWFKSCDIRKVYEEFAKKYNLRIPGAKPVPKALSLQDIFNAAWNRFIVNNGPPAADKNGDCVYYDPSTKNRCAIGAAFNLNQIRELNKYADTTGDSSSALTAGQVVDKFPQWFDTGTMTDEDFALALNVLQYNLHDSLMSTKSSKWSATKVDRVKAYKQYAERYSLQIPVATKKKRKTK